ncbi:pseudouridine synthase, partial [bacterium]|nr:pseudouridine synthase [bacterium]
MKLTLLKMLRHSGYGNRADTLRLIRQKRVSVDGAILSDPKVQLETDGLKYMVDDTEFTFYDKIYVALSKPQGYEVSHSPTHHKSVFELLPDSYDRRKVRGCGRLDADTTGLLLFTDDGKFNQKLMSPKSKVTKTYRVTLKHEVTDGLLMSLKEGVFLKD